MPRPIPPSNTKVLLYHTSFSSTLGGSEYIPLLFIAELQRAGCGVTLALNWKSDLARAAELYNIDIDIRKLTVVQVKPKNRTLCKLDAILPFYTTRQLQKLAKQADICISAANMIDFGKPAHHIVYLMRLFGDNAFNRFVMHEKPLSGLPLFKQKVRTFVAETFLRPLLGMRSTRKILADQREHIYVPSRYVADTMLKFYGPFNCTVFYPPTVFDSAPGAGIRRDPLRVIALGRIQKEKKILEIIDIVERARKESGLDISLHLAGPVTPDEYGERVRRIAGDNPWIRLLGPIYNQDKADFLGSGEYAVHARRDEEFGISVTEYLKAGLITIVPDEGGSMEIVDSPGLTYHTNEEAARILARLLQDEAFRAEQLAHCTERAKLFTNSAYMENQTRILNAILDGAGADS